MKRKIILIIIIIFTALLFKNYNALIHASNTAFEIWLYRVFPFLFIMIIIEDLLINLNFFKFFKKKSTYTFVMSLIGGTPVSAYITGKLYKEKQVSNKEANKMLEFTYFSNPLFLYSILNLIFGSKFITVKLMLIHYASNLIMYLFSYKEFSYNSKDITTLDFSLPSSIKASMNTTLMVLGAITFYFVISEICITTFNMPENIATLFKGFLELTQGLNSLNGSPSELLAILFISFGGVSIHTQVKCILDEYNLSYKNFLRGRILGSIIALILTLIA